MIRLLGNCSNKTNYDYTTADVKKIFTTIESELKIARQKFDEEESQDKSFKLR